MLFLNKRVDEVKNGKKRELLWILEHPTTYTAGVSFNQKEILDKKIKVTLDKKRIRPKKSEVDRLLSKNLKAKKILGWKPKYTGKKGFYRALKITINWFKNPKNLNLYKSDIYNV